jgi:hypothetical protein
MVFRNSAALSVLDDRTDDANRVSHMTTSPTRHAVEQALLGLLLDAGIEIPVNELVVAITQYNRPALFAVIVSPDLRDALSRALSQLTGRLWPTHWEVWILKEADVNKLLTHMTPERQKSS